MIIWKLSKVMHDKKIKGRSLAELVGKHPNTIYRLRDATEMPSIDGTLLNALCDALNCDLTDIIEYVPDGKNCNDSSKFNTGVMTQSATAEMLVKIAQAAGSDDQPDPSLVAELAAAVMEVLVKSKLSSEQK